jgi:hypothetical protein
MKNDKLLTELRKIEADLLLGEPAAYIALQNLIDEVEEEIRDEANKEGGKSSVAKAAERVLKAAQGQPRECFHKAYRGKKGILLCDGYRALRFTSAPILLTHPDGYDYPDIDYIIDGSKYNDVPVNVPSLGELRAFIKTEKARLKAKKQKGVRLVLAEGTEAEIHVNAEFLLDMLEALPGATVTAAKQRTAISALYFKAENGDGVLLPLRPPKKEES